MLLGPRQGGKSTLCQSLQPCLQINLADEETFLSYSKDPGRLKREILALPSSSQAQGVIFLDEIQRIQSLLNTIQTFVETYLREEIRQEALVKDIGSFARFLDFTAVVSGQWIHYSKLAQDTEVPKETVRHFFTLLEDTLLAFRLPSFQPPSKKPSRRVTQRDKIFLFDVGIRNALRKRWKLSSYRSEAEVEVDCVLEREHDFLLLEIKSGKIAYPQDARSLDLLEESLKKEALKKTVQKRLIYSGTSRQRFEKGTLALPYQDFFQELLDSNL